MSTKLKYFLIIIVLIVFGMVVESKTTSSRIGNKGTIKAEEIEEIEMPVPTTIVLTINAGGKIVHYKKESKWNDRDFSEILATRKDFETGETDLLKKSLEKYNLHAFAIEYEFNEKRKSTTLRCDLTGAMYGTNSYDFHWLLGDLPFDLYQFKKLEKELIYDGKVKAVPTRIRLIFPYAIAHCHEHVWPR